MLLHCWWECKLVQLLWKTAWKFLKKLKIQLPYDPEISLLGIYTGELKIGSWRNICTPMFIAALFAVAKRWKQPKRPTTDEWINKMWYIHVGNHYSALKRKEILIHAAIWTNLEDIMLNEINQSQNTKMITMYYFTHMRYLQWSNS